MEQPSRRISDTRLDSLDKRVEAVDRKVGEIRDMLISEPEASPLGRALLKRSVENRAEIDELRTDHETFVKERFVPLERWFAETRGVWRFVLGAGTVLSIVATFFGLAAWFGFGPR